MRDPKIAAAAEKAAAFNNGERGFANMGKINVYACEGHRAPDMTPGAGLKMVQKKPPCGLRMITIDREPGVTPFITKCDGCGGDAVSAAYKVPQNMTPTHEWYRPDSLLGLTEWTIDHILKGGLILRKIEKADDDQPKHRQPEWQRFTGDISVAAMVDGDTPTIGVASDICEACDSRRVLIAAITEAGHEVNVGVPAETALLIADEIRAAALRVIEVGGKA